MGMHDGGAGLEGLVGAFDLLARLIGTAGLSDLRGSEPVMATQMMQGLAILGSGGGGVKPPSPLDAGPGARRLRASAF
jgi:hypothetical protein